MPEAHSGVLVDISYCFYLFNESSWLLLPTDQEVVGSTPTGCAIISQLVDYSQVVVFVG